MRRILLIAAPILLAGVLALVAVLRSNDQNSNDGVNQATNTAPSLTQNQNASTSTPTLDSSRTAILTVSRLFSERFASTSTDQPTSHLEASLPFVSNSLAATFNRIIANPPQPLGDPVVTTSRALAFAFSAFDENNGRATVVVSLQRREEIGSRTRVYNQDLTLQLFRQQGSWKVNAATF